MPSLPQGPNLPLTPNTVLRERYGETQQLSSARKNKFPGDVGRRWQGIKDSGGRSTAADSGPGTLRPPVALAKLLRRCARSNKYARCVSTTHNSLQAKQIIAGKTFPSARGESPLKNGSGTATLPASHRLAPAGPPAPAETRVPRVGSAPRPSRRGGLLQLAGNPAPSVPTFFFKFHNPSRGMFQTENITQRWKEMYRETAHPVQVPQAVRGTPAPSLDWEGLVRPLSPTAGRKGVPGRLHRNNVKRQQSTKSVPTPLCRHSKPEPALITATH